ncbi:hypothetical protein TCAL_14926 [Tigriopus californicus]|uniref:HMG box domain-containing protein n=1 Tax=Tigriopus californicus TaxID=6832 RepID=A0A553N858_TIGCA|nr:hypothetical protein TCAL_14926 [Tigriopus californicus]
MDDSLLGGVSRSGRIRKKSSKLADFESPDEIEEPIVKKKPVKELIPSANPIESKAKIEYTLTDFENAPDQQEDLDDEEDGGDKAKAGSPFLMWGNPETRISRSKSGWSQAELAQQLWAQWQKLPEAGKQAVKAKVQTSDDSPAAKKKRSPVSSIGSPSANNGCHFRVVPRPRSGYRCSGFWRSFEAFGESLTVIGERLTKHSNRFGRIVVRVDGLLALCSGPLMCLTQHVPELNGVPPEELKQILDNVAYIMPGL